MKDIREILSGPPGYQARLARHSGVSKAAISLLKIGKRSLTLNVAQKLASALGLTVCLSPRGKLGFTGRRKKVS